MDSNRPARMVPCDGGARKARDAIRSVRATAARRIAARDQGVVEERPMLAWVVDVPGESALAAENAGNGADFAVAMAVGVDVGDENGMVEELVAAAAAAAGNDKNCTILSLSLLTVAANFLPP